MIRQVVLCIALAASSCFAQLTSKIAFADHRDNGIHLINPDGSGRQKLTDDNAFDGDPAWSPDGRKIAFIRDRDPFDEGNHIYIMGADGANPIQVTSVLQRHFSPAWSPDGTRLTFQIWANRDDTVFSSTLYTIGVDGGPVRQLVAHRNPDAADPLVDSSPNWAPSGDRIVFASAPHSRYIGRYRVIDLFSFNPADGALTNLTNMAVSGINENPTYSPDGTRIAFYSRRPDNEGIYVMGADGANPTPITPEWTIDWAPTWSPDGTRIAFISSRDQTTDIFVMDANGANPINITNDDSGYSSLAWSPLSEFPTAVQKTTWGQLKKTADAEIAE